MLHLLLFWFLYFRFFLTAALGFGSRGSSSSGDSTGSGAIGACGTGTAAPGAGALGTGSVGGIGTGLLSSIVFPFVKQLAWLPMPRLECVSH